MDQGLEPVQITRTIIAGERVFRVAMEQRIDIATMLPMWQYTLIELDGIGVSYYVNGEARLNKNTLWGEIMQRIDAICGIVDIPLDLWG
jgi:hypothetical protein